MASSRPIPEPAPVMIATGSMNMLPRAAGTRARRGECLATVKIQPATSQDTLFRMNPSRLAIFLALALILGVPFALRPATPERSGVPVQTLVVVTPHVPQIRSEFGTAFS